MENKNFEKKTPYDFSGRKSGYSSNDKIKADTYNTCLDRTNAKGIYEKVNALLKKMNPMVANGRVVGYSTGHLNNELEELQTELKKAQKDN